MWNFPLFPDRASTLAPEVDRVFFFHLSVTVFFSLLIASLVIYFAAKYHHKSNADRRGARNSHLLLEVVWTGVPLIIVMVAFVWGGHVFYRMKKIPPDALELFVVGKQWMWKIQHPEGQREINSIHVPVGRPIALTMISEDVIHDFAVPAFRIKQDVLPGRYTKEWFQATKPGVYQIFCNQYCGTLHAQMTGKIIAMTPPDYEAWLGGGAPASASGGLPANAASLTPAVPVAGNKAEAPPGPALNPQMIKAGAALFKDVNCISCHKPDRTGRGPALEGLFGTRVQLEGGKTVVADENYIRESILQPNAKVVKGYKPVMPTFQGQLEAEELNELVVYIESLKRSQ